MTHIGHAQTRRQLLTHTMGAAVGIYGILHIAKPAVSAFPQPGAGGVPASVDRMMVAVDGWGRDVINPVQPTGGAFLPDYFNLLLLMRDENQQIVPALATEWRLTDEGFEFAIHPKAKWHDGTPVTAEDIKWSFEAMRGDFSPQFRGHHAATRFKEQIGEVRVVDQKHVRITTKKPAPDFLAFYTGAGYHQVHFGPPHYLQQVGVEGYEKKPSGGGPYTVKEWKPGERMVLERWEEFWGDYPWYHKPQHKTLEFILAPDSASRFALLKSRQVDVAVNIPYGVAKDLPQSEAFEGRGINPNKGAIWTQTITATGNYNLVFTGLQQFQNAPNKPTPEQLKPFDDIRVRQAMALALDKVAISAKAHFGFTKPMAGLWFTNAFGHRSGLQVSPYDPARAKQLLKEAGYPNGFSTTIYYGPFVNSPGIREWLEAAASFWRDVGIEAKIFEIETNQFYSQFARGQVPDWKWQPLAVQTWGRQEHAGVQATYGYHATGTYRCCFDARSDELWQQATATTDEAVQLKALAELEDYVLQQYWVIPMTEVSIVIGYTDRVLAHLHPPHASAFEQFWRVVARK